MCHGASGPERSQPALIRLPAAPATDRVSLCAGWGGWRVVFSSRETLERKRREQRAKQRAVLLAPLEAILRRIFSVLFPLDCRVSSNRLNRTSRIPICTECLEAIQPLHAPRCLECGDRLDSVPLLVGDGRCHSCRDFESEFARARFSGEYEGRSHGLIQLLKYKAVSCGCLGTEWHTFCNTGTAPRLRKVAVTGRSNPITRERAQRWVPPGRAGGARRGGGTGNRGAGLAARDSLSGETHAPTVHREHRRCVPGARPPAIARPHRDRRG